MSYSTPTIELLPVVTGKSLLELPLPQEANPQMHELNFRWRNQRQVRKNRRRAHAAGRKNAFA